MVKTSATTVNADEAAHFGALAAEWWDPKGSSAMLHRLNPVRLRYVREAVDMHFDTDPRSLRPLAGKRALDVGCGAGLLTEPLARMGAEVTGLDAAAENVAAASAHAEGQGLDITYRAGGIEGLADRGFDLVTAMEVVEHVDAPEAFAAGLAGALADDGMLVMSTPNRTAASKLLLVEGAEALGAVPRGTHDWDKFFTPEELEKLLNGAGLKVTDVTGLSFSIGSGFKLSDNKALNYLVTAVRS